MGGPFAVRPQVKTAGGLKDVALIEDLEKSVYLYAREEIIGDAGGTGSSYGTSPNIAYLRRCANAAVQGMSLGRQIPDDAVGGSPGTLGFVVRYTGDAAVLGTVRWRLNFLKFVIGTTLVDATGTEVFLTSTCSGTAKLIQETARINVSTTFAANDEFRLGIHRIGNDIVEDLYGGNIDIHSIIMFYNARKAS